MITFIKFIAVALGVLAIVIMLAALGLVVGILPDTGYGGVVLVDSIFGTLVLFTAARLMWLSAERRQRREDEAKQTAVDN
ncbi:MAG: hypothetical protein ACR2P6_03805 [Gammaproteobacteria bacterium]